MTHHMQHLSVMPGLDPGIHSAKPSRSASAEWIAGSGPAMTTTGRETTMKATYDEQANALYVRFTNAAIDASEEVRPGLIIDFDADGRIVAFEMLDANTQLAPGALAGLAAA
jgi:uncharacterized protein YuzE